MTGSAAKIILSNLTKSRLKGFLHSLKQESNGDLLVALCTYFHKNPSSSEEATCKKFHLTPGRYYHFTGVIGTALTVFLAGNRDTVFLSQTYVVACDAVSAIQMDAAADLIRTGIRLATAVEDFDMELRFWELSKLLPKRLVIDGYSPEKARAMRHQVIQYSDLLARMDHIREHRGEASILDGVLPLLEDPLLSIDPLLLTSRARFCYLKAKAIGQSLKRNYQQAIENQELLVSHVEAYPWIFPDGELQLAKEIKALARLFRLLRFPEKFHEVSTRFFEKEFKSLLAEQEKVILRFPTSLVAAIDKGDEKTAKLMVDELRRLLDSTESAFDPKFVTANLYHCLYVAVATVDVDMAVRLVIRLRSFGRGDFRPAYYLMYRLLEVVTQVYTKDFDQASVLLRSLRVVTGLDQLAGFEKVLLLLGKILPELSSIQLSNRNTSLLEHESVQHLMTVVSGQAIVDYFDIPNWLISLAEGRTMMEILQQSATSTSSY